MTEAELLDAILKLAGVFKWKTAHFRPAQTKDGWRTAVAGDGKGFPDLVLVRDRVVFAELKSLRGRLAVEQQDWLHSLKGAGGEVYLWYPQDWVDGTIEGILR